ncbi:modular serine protease isoform X1 [Tribolium castaneum]|nr:PREDICTED: suppressor of tumorigenicity 14 protein [Tribolium castaneum]|eukprot:XP_970945.2 PREDICTED: suppressor of tumorigenicity 14 protein [Tribolium castaneum]
MKMCSATLIQVIRLFLAIQIVHSFSFYQSNITKREVEECPSNTFACKSGECIDEDMQCDGGVDCKDASDESNACARINCPIFAFRCDYGACIFPNLECDGKPDCRDGSDEKTPKCQIIDETSPICRSNEFRCSSGECIDEDNKCDGIAQCSDRSDEIRATCWNLRCPSYSFKCKYGACVSGNAECNGKIECPDGSDEDPNICKNSTVVVTPTPPPVVTRPGARGRCVLPNHPEFGKWKIFGPDNLSPGATVNPGTILNIVCQNGYKLEGNSVIYCANGQWTENIGVCLKLCSPLSSTKVMTVTCTYPNNKGEGNCTNAIDGTLARFKCEPLYEDPNLQRIPGRVCRDGTWDNSSPECVPVCGQKSVEVQKLIVNGKTAKRGTYPWQAALYTRDKKELICGGSLIKLNMIITAAHCVTDQQDRAQPLPKENYIVALGKYYRKFDDPRDSKEAQFSELKKIIVNEKYGGPIQNFGSDIALLITSTVFVPSLRVQPVCMDWNLECKIGEDQVYGYVTGWGYTVEGSNPSEELKELKVPLIPESKCQKDLPLDYIRYYTYDKLCAGYLNSNTSVCRGDSGGGLVVKRNGDRFYLTGIVSLSPTSPRDIDGCDSQQYGLYTKVACHTQDFILKKVTEYGINAR